NDAPEELKKHIASVPQTKNGLQKVVANLARNLYKVRISTLDSVFNKIASTFTLELGLPAGWTIAEDDGFAGNLSVAVSNVLQNSPQNNVKKILADFQKGESARSITQQLVALAKDILPLAYETELHHWQHQNLSGGLLADDETVLRQTEFLESAVLPQVQRNWIEPFEKARQTVVNAVRNKDWKTVLGTGFIQNTLNGKKSYKVEFASDLWNCAEILGKHAAGIELEILAGQTEAAYKLLKLIADEYQKVAEQTSAYRFDDITQKLRAGNIVSRFSGESLKHRLNGSAEHLLLDEFQDTSMPQWEVLHPFIEYADSRRNKNGSVFVVGDQKQAIYGWRGGVAEIFDTVKSELNPEELPLDKSFRSSQIIIDVVNRLFGGIIENEALTLKNEYTQAAVQWSGRFKKHISEKNYDGFVSLETVPEEANENENESGEETGGSKTDPYYDYVAKRIDEIHRKRPDGQIGILTRGGAAIGKAVASLKKIGIEASEEGGVPLTNSAAVQVVLSAMKLADHPGDTAARFHLVHTLHLPENFSAEKYSLDIRRQLIQDGYGKTVKSFVPLLLPLCDDREYERLQKLVELAYRFDEEASGVRTRRFIERVETAKVESPSAAKIRVMTIHRSKGLEFDIVVLPELHAELAKTQSAYIVARKNPASPVDWVLRYVNKDLRMFLPPDYREAFAVRTRNEVIESLSLLYVAMTRAKHELLMLLPEKSKPENPRFSGIVLSGLGANYQHGHRNWQLPDEKKVSPNTSEADEPLNCTLKKSTKHKLLPETPSSLETSIFAAQVPPTIPPLTAAHLSRADAQLRGTAIHKCFESVKWLNETPDKDGLLKLVQKEIDGKTDNLKAEEIVDDFLQFAAKDDVKAALSRSAYPAEEDIAVETERRFAVRDIKEKKLRYGSIDRLVVRRKNGKITGLDVIDFKTGDTPNEMYQDQMNAYRSAIALLYKIDEKHITAKIINVENT
ncbi:MAG: UvrD-helicase domain-containing protein, partial [Planctomycetaceae bacterium]|nr:UvrD-helicase domain-containing protein [Planctomycetaceae bacterium]